MSSRTPRRATIVVWLLVYCFSACLAHAQNLSDLLTLQNYSAYRKSSADPSGGNLDMRRIDARQALTVADLEGPGVITHIWFTYMYPSRSALRKLVIRIYFDDINEPCVEAPLGDFFGLGNAQSYAYASQPLAVGTHAGLNCYWPMPFASRARIVVANEGDQDCNALYYQVDYRKLEKPSSTGLHFFARYYQAFPPMKKEPYLILKTDGGQGHYVGCNLSVEQQDESWWGEGDVSAYVDGEVKPSLAGTGSEDDFGGAWCYSHEFSFPQFGAPFRGRFNSKGLLERCTPDLRGKDLGPWRWPEAWKVGDLWNVYRYHIADPIPFKKSIRVDIEHGWQGNERSDWYSSVAYWYQTGQPVGRVALPKSKDRMPKYLRPHDHGGGRWEGEDLVDVARVTGGKVVESGQEFWGDMFSGQYALEWEAQNTNDTLVLPFSVPKTGKYKVVARLVRRESGGSFRVNLDEFQPVETVNLFQIPPFPGPFDLVIAEQELGVGEHTIKVVALEPDKQAKGKLLLLDKVQIEAVGNESPGKK